jgi:acylphosphatase
MIRRTVLFTGQVQGVGFRQRTLQASHGYPITGYVRNLPDGRVELVAEGDAELLDRFVGEVCRRLHGHIEKVDWTDSPVTGEFSYFSINRG